MKKSDKNQTIKIQLIKSFSGYHKNQIGTVRALGFTKLNQIIEVKNNPIINGMIFKVKHLVKVIN